MAPALRAALVTSALAGTAVAQEMEKMWGENVVKLRATDAKRGQLFDEGNYAMFIHWGLYSQLANKVDGKTYYGIGEWIMNKNMAGIPIAEYKELARTFNPVKFDAKEIVQLAKDAGMKYIIITSKHHDGFAMYDSAVNDFNVVDATPFSRDPMKDLAAACREAGIGFGFYYSHNQDWTFPGGGNGPGKDEDGNRATFDDYFVKKCLPQVEEITTGYGPIEIVWFDTPGKMPKKYVEQLVEVVRKNQPNALVSGRAGHGLGDYQSLGDMEVPVENVEGMWETVDTTNDSWAFAYYDENWKTAKTILERVIATVARGGTYMLNIGPRGDGSVPERAATALRESGAWIHKYPQVVYNAQASPWEKALPWGDVTVHENSLLLSVFDWPVSGKLYLPGLKTEVKAAKLLIGGESEPLTTSVENGWTVIDVPKVAPEKLVSVVQVDLAGAPDVDPTVGLDPNTTTTILATFAEVEGATLEGRRWMEKFGEWKHVDQVCDWTAEGSAAWEVEVLVPGDYAVDLKYSGKPRVVWKVAVDGGEVIQNQQNASPNYQTFPIGWLNFPKAGRYTVKVSCVEGSPEKKPTEGYMEDASLSSISFTPVR
ncbi:MAG: alpha-L-fucosidase [Verrucomicrobiales bacterium]